ncbi:MAG: hypothetical protein AAFP90_17800 [Planctomycetota bacterium]
MKTESAKSAIYGRMFRYGRCERRFDKCYPNEPTLQGDRPESEARRFVVQMSGQALAAGTAATAKRERTADDDKRFKPDKISNLLSEQNETAFPYGFFSY